MYSISKKAVASQLGPVFSITLRKRKGFTADIALASFKKWLKKHQSSQEQEIIENYVFGILDDTERRLKQVRGVLEKEIFYKLGGRNGATGKFNTTDTE